MGLVVATRSTDEGAAFVDSRTAVAFMIGSIAGLARIEPAMAIIGVILLEASQDVASKGKNQLVKKQSGESYANQIMDVLATTMGVYLGNYIRDVADQRELMGMNPEAAPPAISAIPQGIASSLRWRHPVR